VISSYDERPPRNIFTNVSFVIIKLVFRSMPCLERIFFLIKILRFSYDFESNSWRNVHIFSRAVHQPKPGSVDQWSGRHRNTPPSHHFPIMATRPQPKWKLPHHRLTAPCGPHRHRRPRPAGSSPSDPLKCPNRWPRCVGASAAFARALPSLLLIATPSGEQWWH
jgi:hypothetical protein